MGEKDKKVPKLRFPGFTEPWEQRKLGDIADRVMRKNQDLVSTLPLTISAQYGLIGVRTSVLLYTYGFQNALELAANGNAVTFLPETFLTEHMLSQYEVDVFEIEEKYDAYWTIDMCCWNQNDYDDAMMNFIQMSEKMKL